METQKLKVVLASEEYREAVVDGLSLRMALEEHETPDVYDRESVSNLFTSTVESGTCWIAVIDNQAIGVLAAIPSRHLMNNKKTILSEIIWYVLPEFRKTKAALKLFNMFNEESKKYDLCSFSLLPHSDVDPSFLERKGFVMKEFGFLKGSKWQQ